MKLSFFDLFINIDNEQKYLDAIENSLLNESDQNIFYYLNSFGFYLAFKNQLFKEALQQSDYIIPDGYSIVWAVNFLQNIVIDKVVFTYSFSPNICSVFNQCGSRIFILGGKESELNKAIKNISEQGFSISIAGSNHGYFSINNETDYIIEKINASHADVLIVAMGMPRSEIWIFTNKDKLHPKVIFSVGGFLSFLSGEKKIAPQWMYNSGLEWVYRLVQEPVRLWKRYLVANIFFLSKVVTEKVSNAIK